jgi:AbiTii
VFDETTDVSHRRYPPLVNNRSQRLLKEIEDGALNSNKPTGDVLRTAIALGGEAGSGVVAEWATKELRGYEAEDELPAYRTIRAPLQLDAINSAYTFTGQTISPLALPAVAHGKITNDIPLYQGIAEIDRHARQDEVIKVLPPFAQELIKIMNSEGRVNGHVQQLYWGVSPVSFAEVVEQVRTTLTVMISEIRRTMPDKTEDVPAAVADNAMSFAVTGKRNTVTVMPA